MDTGPRLPTPASLLSATAPEKYPPTFRGRLAQFFDDHPPIEGGLSQVAHVMMGAFQHRLDPDSPLGRLTPWQNDVLPRLGDFPKEWQAVGRYITDADMSDERPEDIIRTIYWWTRGAFVGAHGFDHLPLEF